MTVAPPLPEEPRLRALAEAIEAHGAIGELMDHKWRIVFISTELCRMLGIPADGGLQFVGRVGTGFTEKELTKLPGIGKVTAARIIEHRTAKPVIVIDPGHGGKDSGAMKYGTVEKDVVLKFSLVLRDKLIRSGRYEVLMTRDDDTFVPLGERRDFAERHKAALFIAVHADYASTRASGATIYSLRERVANRLRSSAREEVTKSVLSDSMAQEIKQASAGDVSIVRQMLADLAERDVEATRNRTRIFTQAVIDTMSDATAMRQNPDKEAAYKVLKTAKVPSVLIELAYVSNRQDAARLRSDAWRDKVSDSIAAAVDNYFSHIITRVPL